MKALIEKKTKREHYYLDKKEIEQIKLFMVEQNITQNELAIEIGITKGYLCNILNGKSPIGVKARRGLIKATGIKLIVQ